MQIITDYKPTRAQPRPHTPVQTWTPRRAASPVRNPEAEGLSRAELRRIVIDMIG